MSLLEVTELRAGYGDFQALFDISLTVEQGETLAVIGANGAGKSTFLKTLCGVIPAMSGSVRFDGRDLLAVPAHRRVSAGIAMVPEGRRLFPSLSVRENLEIGAYAGRSDGPWNLDRVLEVFPLITRLLDRPSDVLSGGEKQTVAIGRALMSNPKLLLMDECSLGLAPVIVKRLYAAMPRIREGGTGVIIVEQDIEQALVVADRVCCFLEGRLVLEGTPTGLTRRDVTAAYFGLDSHGVP